METILTAASMAAADKYSIDKGIPSLVLMERAALSVKNVLYDNDIDVSKTLIVCGTGNNAADGVALARLLAEDGYYPEIFLSGDPAKYSHDLNVQLEIASNYDIKTVKRLRTQNYSLIVDAIFGIGLKRDITGDFATAINKINEGDTPVVSIDIPSGLNADNGDIMGTAVSADLTVTFQYAKVGQLIKNGPALCGELYIENIGILPESPLPEDEYFAITEDDFDHLPARNESGNKGDFGKLLVIAGGEDIFGAAYLCACAALRSGIGMVKVFTHSANRTPLCTLLPESLITTYEGCTEDLSKLKKDLEWADAVVCGPGIGTGDFANALLKELLTVNTLPLVLDADALNIIAGSGLKQLRELKCSCTVTPHIGEMSRLTGLAVSDIKNDPLTIAARFAEANHVTCVLKDSCTVTAYPSGLAFINTSGCSALATAGSGDVLSGMIAGYTAKYRNVALPLEAMAVYRHGTIGEDAAEDYGADAVTAATLLEYI